MASSKTETPLSGPGWLYVESKITRWSDIDTDTFITWYEDQHIPELVAMSGISCARWYRDMDPTAERPYLAVYTMDDLAFVHDEEFKGMSMSSDLFPEDFNIFGLAEFFMRQDSLVQVYDPYQIRNEHKTKTILSVQTELKEDADVDTFNRCYHDECLPLMAKSPGYLRTTRCKLAGVNGNATSVDAPTWIAVHEFSTDDIDLDALMELVASPATTSISDTTKREVTRKYKLINVYGDVSAYH